VLITTQFPDFTRVAAVRVPAGNHLIIARLDVSGRTYFSALGTTRCQILRRLGGGFVPIDEALFGQFSFVPEIVNTFNLPGTLSGPVALEEDSDLEVRCTLESPPTDPSDVAVGVTPRGFFSLDLGTITVQATLP
jgi:hypothetical protein